MNAHVEKPLTIRLVGWSLIAQCLLMIGSGLYSFALSFKARPSLGLLLGALVLASALMGIGFDLSRGRRWAADFLVCIGVMSFMPVVCLLALAPDLLSSFGFFAIVFALAIVQAILLVLPSSRQWFCARENVGRGRQGCLVRGIRFIVRCVLLVVLFLGAFAIVILVENMPSYATMSRILSHGDLSRTLDRERDIILSSFRQSKSGTEYTVVVFQPLRVLASGPAVFVYGSDGRLVDSTVDVGDSPGFRERWEWRGIPKARAGTDPE